jgi:hypothetical protein
MALLNRFTINFVILSMCADKSYCNSPANEHNNRHYTESIAFYIKNIPRIPYVIGRRKRLFLVVVTFPFNSKDSTVYIQRSSAPFAVACLTMIRGVVYILSPQGFDSLYPFRWCHSMIMIRFQCNCQSVTIVGYMICATTFFFGF